MPLPTTEEQRERQKTRYLRALATSGTLRASCKAARISAMTVLKWREFDDEFTIREHQAREDFADRLEEAATERALNGSDVLTIFLLKANRPEKYRERHDVTSGGQPLQTANADLDRLIADRLAEVVARGEVSAALASEGTAEPAHAGG